MKIIKKDLGELKGCYAVSSMHTDQGDFFLFASEDRAGKCIAYSEQGVPSTVWEEPGGTMSLVPLPGENGVFLASQKFYPVFQAEYSKIVIVKRETQGWKVEPLVDVPYLHRFDVLQKNGKRYLVCSTLCSSKKQADDWSSPGKVYAAELPHDLGKPVLLRPVLEGLTRHHGYCRFSEKDGDRCLVAADEGVFSISPPETPGEKWKFVKRLDRPVSDVATADLDGCGKRELITIEPFHGDRLVVYQEKDGEWNPVYDISAKLKFIHALWAGSLCGEPAAVVGCRGGERELLLLRYENKRYVTQIIDKGAGPSNLAVCHGAAADILLAANRESDRMALYYVRKE